VSLSSAEVLVAYGNGILGYNTLATAHHLASKPNGPGLVVMVIPDHNQSTRCPTDIET